MIRQGARSELHTGKAVTDKPMKKYRDRQTRPLHGRGSVVGGEARKVLISSVADASHRRGHDGNKHQGDKNDAGTPLL